MNKQKKRRRFCMSKRFSAVLLVVLMVTLALLTGCSSGGDKKPVAKEAAAKKVIRISIGLNEVHPEFLGLKKFKEIVEGKTNGRYDVQLYANAQLGDDVKATEALRAGTLEMTGPSSSPLAGISKELMVFDLPFLFPNTKVAYQVMDGPVGQKILDSLEAKGLKGLAYWENGFRHLTNSVRDVKDPADIKGLKIRVMQNPIHMATWKAMGANPTPMPFSEVFTAMQQKTIDGQENPIPTIYLSKYNEVQKYATLTGHVYTPHMLLISKKVWDTMDKEDQKIFQDASYVARDYVRQISKEMNDSQVGKLREAGMTVTELTPAQLKVFQDSVKPVYDEFADKIGKTLVDEMQAEVVKANK
jgi:tripartite ATP-independent transporter DctP family solute receptor